VIVYGRNPVAELLRGRRAGGVQEVWASAGALREPWLQAARGRGLRVRRRPAEEIARLCGSDAHQGVAAPAGPYPYVAPDELLGGAEPLLVVLDQVQDPHNLGSICRSAECAGATGVVVPERRAAAVTPAVCKASAGAVEHLAVARVRNIADFLAEARRAGCWCYGASAGPAGKRAAVRYDAPDYRGAVALVLGSEGAGLRPRVARACDQLIALPVHGRVGSLGVSAAAAALLYEILQRRQEGVDKNP
jgi:23S rRNA (guanosine2251-2'-O)-methyltransferase